MFPYAEETFSTDEVEVLRRYVTNVEGPVFALVNLPEVVKGALFARYSRSAKSLRNAFANTSQPLSGDFAAWASSLSRTKAATVGADCAVYVINGFPLTAQLNATRTAIATADPYEPNIEIRSTGSARPRVAR